MYVFDMKGLRRSITMETVMGLVVDGQLGLA